MDSETGEVVVLKPADYAKYIRAQGGVNMGKDYRIGTDIGNTWRRVNDWAHQYGSNGAIVSAGMNTFGVVYMTTAGRGLEMGRP